MKNQIIVVLAVSILSVSAIAQEETKVQEPEDPAKPAAYELFLSGGWNLSLADTINMNFFGNSGANTVDSSSHRSSDIAMTLSLEAGVKRLNDFGLSLGVSFDTPRDDGNGRNFIPILGTANVLYSFKYGTVFFGPNYSSVDYSPELQNGQKIEVGGAFGYQIGADLKVSDSMDFTAYWRRASVKLHLKSASDEVRTNGKLEGLQLGVKYRFR